MSEFKINGPHYDLADEGTMKHLEKNLGKEVKVAKDYKWTNKKISSELHQGIAAGEPINKIAGRIQNVSGATKGAAIRNARTMTTAAENKGRKDSAKTAKESGLIIHKIWIATNDDRTREEHEELDGQEVELDEAFEVNGYSLDYPGDPDGEPEMVYNCRCSMKTTVVGVEPEAIPEEEEDLLDDEIEDLLDDEISEELNSDLSDFFGGLETENAEEITSLFSEKEFNAITQSKDDMLNDDDLFIAFNNAHDAYNFDHPHISANEFWDKMKAISDLQKKGDLPKKKTEINLTAEEQEIDDLFSDLADEILKYEDYNDFYFNVSWELDEKFVDAKIKYNETHEFSTKSELFKKAKKIFNKKNSVSIEETKQKELEKQQKKNEEQKAKFKEAKKKLDEIKPEFDALKNETYSGIWYHDVKLSDYKMLEESDSILSKEYYYQTEIKKLEDKSDLENYEKLKLENLKQKWNELLDFETKGKKYSEIQEKYEKARNEYDKLAPIRDTETVIETGAFSQERKDNAIWAQNTKTADKYLRKKCGEVWRESSRTEQLAVYEYTESFHKFNEPLRGIEYGTGEYKGVGKTDLNASYANNGNNLNAATRMIEKSSYEEDFWLQRGVNYHGMDKFFNCDSDLLRYGTQEELEQELLGTTPIERAFMSCGVAKGKGFDGDIILNIYAPSGTKMMYLEPFSAYSGSRIHEKWDGYAEQDSFGYESEILLQQNTQFRITKIERTNNILYFDLEVIGQLPPQVYYEE